MTSATGGPGDDLGVDGLGTDGADYGYDMAHDDVVRGTPPAADEARRDPGAPGDDRPDAGGDYGYDEAHDLR